MTATSLTRQEQIDRLADLGVHVPPEASDTEVHQLLIRTLSERLTDVIEGETKLVEDPALDGDLVVEERSADLVPRSDARPQIPTAAIWAHLAMMAEPLARSNLVKPALRGKPNDVLMVLLTGYDLQITMTQALAKVHVIEGQPSASPELILGLIRREGHRAWPGGPDNSGTEQESEDLRTLAGVVHAVRKDDPDRIITVRYSIAQAEQAGLVKVDGNKLIARSQQGKALPWEQYPEDLLWARAVSRLGRRNFSDVLLGLSYVPEELGYIDAASYEAPPQPAVRPDSVEMMPSRREELRTRIRALPDPVKKDLSVRWGELIKANALRPLDHLRETEFAAAGDLIGNYEAKAKALDVVPATSPPCTDDVVLDPLPFPCDDHDQTNTPKVCPDQGQCAAAGECLRSPI